MPQTVSIKENPPMTRRHRATLRCGLAAMALLVSGSAIAQTQLDFWSWRQEDIKAYNEIIAEFEAPTSTPKCNTGHSLRSGYALTAGMAGRRGFRPPEGNRRLSTQRYQTAGFNSTRRPRP